MRSFGATLLAAAASAVLWAAMGPAGCSRQDRTPGRAVVVYTSLDQVFSEPILKAFEHRTGISVLPVYDAESAKTTGLVSRLIARRDNPDCDVFWNAEPIQTQRLAGMGLLAPYPSPSAQRIPSRFRDANARWTGFAARTRVLIYNTKLVSALDAPKGLADLADPKWRGKAAIARPFYGTTLSHMAALYHLWGPRQLGEYLQSLRANDVALCAGNAPVRDLVASGERAMGLIDSDDAYQAILDGKPVRAIIPDSEQGAYVIPNTVAIINRCPHPKEAQLLVDYLLSADVEKALAAGGGAQIPLGTDLAGWPTAWRDMPVAKAMPLDIAAAAASLDSVVEFLRSKEMDR